METQREMEQEVEWVEAQKIGISLDLVSAAKQQLQFLAAVDRNRWLYEGLALEKAIYRYNACWRPLLAKHSESPIFDGPLVVPLDCEWIWHCHRLNPVRYKSDCEELFGRILDYSNVISSTKEVCGLQTQEIWNTLYPDEPYDFKLERASSDTATNRLSDFEKCTTYDLVSAVKRQSPFFYQVSRPHMKNNIFLEEAVARYKGFLHLIKRNKEKSIRQFCVPTYDIDLIWHTHQLHPVFYCKDLREALGKILEHDDMDSDRTKGQKLDVGFSATVKQWEQTFGTRYIKAGAMYRGAAPSFLTAIPVVPNMSSKEILAVNDWKKSAGLQESKIVEVFAEIVGAKNLPDDHKGTFFVTVSKKQSDLFFGNNRKLTIQSETGEKRVTSFLCELKGELSFELWLHSPTSLPLTKSWKSYGTASFSLQDLLTPLSRLAMEKWVELLPCTGNMISKPIYLRIALSFTIPIEAPHVLRMADSNWLSKTPSCFPGRVQFSQSGTRVIDATHGDMFSLQIRQSARTNSKSEGIPKKQVMAIIESSKTKILAELVGTHWSLMDSQWSLKLTRQSNEDAHIADLVGYRMLQILGGRRLEFEPKHRENQRSEEDFVTVLEFSAEYPYGKAVALLNLKSGWVEVNEEWLVLPGIITAFILSYILKKEGRSGFIAVSDSLQGIDDLVNKVNKDNVSDKSLNQSNLNNSTASGGCGCGCGGQCGNILAKSGGSCGSGCGSECGNVVKSGGYGGGCGGCGGNLPETTTNTSACGVCGGGCSSRSTKIAVSARIEG